NGKRLGIGDRIGQRHECHTVDLCGTSPVAELGTRPVLAGSAIASRSTGAAASAEPAAPAPESASGATEARPGTPTIKSAAPTCRRVLPEITTRPPHTGHSHAVHHGEIRLCILGQALAQAARYLESLVAVLTVHRRCGRGGLLGCCQVAL